jgi:Cu(I)/Ag(I) efflux system periplasmic protein CusF
MPRVLVAVAVAGWTAWHAGPLSAGAAASTGVQPAYVLGEVVSIAPDRSAVVLRHGPIPHLGMPDMTMRFRIADSRRWESVRAGDVIRFLAEKRDGTFVVTSLAPK